jgi:hypothetical protein
MEAPFCFFLTSLPVRLRMEGRNVAFVIVMRDLRVLTCDYIVIGRDY